MTAPADILAVDDDERNLRAVEAIVEGLPVNLVKVRSGAEALRALLARRFAVILLDVHMPGMDGFETATLVRSSERTRHIPIIFLTANSDLGRAAIGYAHGAVDYLFKPIVPEILRAKISVFVELERKNHLVTEMQAREHDRRLADERRRFEEELLRAKLEQERQAAADLAAANEQLAAALAETRRALATRDQFLRMASHELKTPLTSMQLTLENALRRGGEPLSGPPERLLRALRILDGQTDRLSHLAQELLSIAVIQEGRLRLVPTELELGELAGAVAEDHRYLLQAAGCPISIVAPSPVRGRWDRFWLTQALSNLVANALKFGAGRPIELAIRAEARGATLSVRDWGIGIPHHEHARIFEPFVRAVSTDHYGGLGLGLHIVQRIVDEHGGAVSVDSAPGEGATFTVVLPHAGRDAAP